jgi:hypothetical protein
MKFLLKLKVGRSNLNHSSNVAITGFRSARAGIGGIGTLLTADGKVVKMFKITDDHTKLDVSDLYRSIYILKIESAESVVLKRVVIQ